LRNIDYSKKERMDKNWKKKGKESRKIERKEIKTGMMKIMAEVTLTR
jgi:uncharacterized iron-regulated protein